jgi:anti-anti-sigma factor
MELIESKVENLTIVEPRGRMDSAGAKPFGDRIVELIRSGSHHILIDMRHILYISSAGFRSLLIAGKLIDERKGRLVLCGLSSEVKRLFDMGAFTDLFTICETRDEGIDKTR